jgi:hypothetical protein
MLRTAPSSRPLVFAAAMIALLVAACAMPPSKEEEEAAKNTFACASGSERIVIRFDVGEARLLMADGNRVALYQIPARDGRPLFERQRRASRQRDGPRARALWDGDPAQGLSAVFAP